MKVETSALLDDRGRCPRDDMVERNHADILQVKMVTDKTLST